MRRMKRGVEARRERDKLREVLRELLSLHDAGYVLPPGTLGVGDIRDEAWDIARAALSPSGGNDEVGVPLMNTERERNGKLERVLLFSRHRCHDCRWRWFRLARYRRGSEVRYYCADCAKRKVRDEH